MFPDYPWYTQLFFWAILGVLAILGWGVAVTLRGAVLSTGLRLCTGGLQGLTRLCIASGLGSGLGSAHWACGREVRQSGVLTPGMLPLAQWRGQTLYEAMQRHVLVLGPSGSGKSYGALMGMLRTWEGNTITTDLKGELWDHTHAERQARGKAWRFAPTEAASCNLDVLEAIDWGTDLAYGQVERLAKHLLQPPKQQKTAGFEDAAGPLLVAAILHCHDLGRQGLPGVIEWALDPAKARDAKLEEMLASSNQYVQQGARGVLDESINMRGVVWANAWKPLALFRDKRIASHTRTSDIDWRAFMSGPQPQSLYLVIPAAEISRCGAFLGCLVEALLALLANPALTPQHQTLICLDELANCGYLDQLERAISYLRSARVQVVLAFQSLLQVLDVYGPTSPLLASVHTLVAYSPTVCDDVTGDWLSRRLGVRTTWAQSFGAMESASQGTSASLGLSTSSLGLQMGMSESAGQMTSVGQSQTVRALLLPDEIRRLPEGVALVMTGNCAPIWGEKFPRPGAVPVSAWHRLRPGRKSLIATSALLLLGVVLWPVWQRYRLATWTQAARQERPLMPWEQDHGMPLSLALKAQGQQQAAEKGLPSTLTMADTVAILAHEAEQKRHPRSEEDLAMGRKPQSLLEEEAARARGTWTPNDDPARPWHLQGNAAEGYRTLARYATREECGAGLRPGEHRSCVDQAARQQIQEDMQHGPYFLRVPRGKHLFLARFSTRQSCLDAALQGKGTGCQDRHGRLLSAQADQRQAPARQ